MLTNNELGFLFVPLIVGIVIGAYLKMRFNYGLRKVLLVSLISHFIIPYVHIKTMFKYLFSDFKHSMKQMSLLTVNLPITYGIVAAILETTRKNNYCFKSDVKAIWIHYNNFTKK